LRRPRHGALAEILEVQVKALLLVLLCSCSPATRIAGRCPTLPTLAVDFTIASVGLGASVMRYGVGHPAETPILFSSAMLVALAANLSECR